jgi:hypothetical protein
MDRRFEQVECEFALLREEMEHRFERIDSHPLINRFNDFLGICKNETSGLK